MTNETTTRLTPDGSTNISDLSFGSSPSDRTGKVKRRMSHFQCESKFDLSMSSLTKLVFARKKYTIATTILDQKIYSRDWITSTYRSRWLVELDIRSMKCTLGMDIIRVKTPEMVRTEILSCLLAYNLITMKMLQSSAISGRMPRSLSLTTTLQSLATHWLLASVRLTAELI